jgi:hypothetical protein
MSIAQVALSSGLTVSYASIGGHSGPALLMLPGPTDSWRSYAAVLTESASSSCRARGEPARPWRGTSWAPGPPSRGDVGVSYLEVSSGH